MSFDTDHSTEDAITEVLEFELDFVRYEATLSALYHEAVDALESGEFELDARHLVMTGEHVIG